MSLFSFFTSDCLLFIFWFLLWLQYFKMSLRILIRFSLSYFFLIFSSLFLFIVWTSFLLFMLIICMFIVHFPQLSGDAWTYLQNFLIKALKIDFLHTSLDSSWMRSFCCVWVLIFWQVIIYLNKIQEIRQRRWAFNPKCQAWMEHQP